MILIAAHICISTWIPCVGKGSDRIVPDSIATMPTQGIQVKIQMCATIKIAMRDLFAACELTTRRFSESKQASRQANKRLSKK